MNDIGIIKLTGRRDGFALVDAARFSELNELKWSRNDHGYAVRRVRVGVRKFNRKKTIRMHRLVLGAPEGVDVDHRNGFACDNTSRNLRLATDSQNLANAKKRRDAVTSKFKGVCFDKSRSKWMTRVAKKFIGYFNSEERAALAYNEAALQRYGEHARLNSVKQEAEL